MSAICFALITSGAMARLRFVESALKTPTRRFISSRTINPITSTPASRLIAWDARSPTTQTAILCGFSKTKRRHNMNNQILSLKSIVRRESNKRHAFSKDRRLTLNCVIAEYVGNQDHEPYRKAFYAKGEP